MRRTRAAAVCAAAALLLAPATVAGRQVSPPPTGTLRGTPGTVASGTLPGTLIDVPYVAQTPELCGGAALAMVLRYWGDAGAAAQDFAPLVNHDDGGIRTDLLAGAARTRGWQAVPTRARPGTGVSDFDTHLRNGQPVIALIEERSGTFHYVVVIARTETAVIVHDPARAPFRVLPIADFERRWAPASRWMMLVLPADPGGETTRRPLPAGGAPGEPRAPNSTSPCHALVEASIARAQAGDLAGADDGLTAASRLCPDQAAPWRELAGVRLRQARWPDVQQFAQRAIAIAPDDRHAWQVLATARFVTDDARGALDAWNRAGEPRVNSVDVMGAERTRHPVVVDLVGLSPGQVLTAQALSHSTRRLRQLPVASSASVRYTPVEDGAAVQAIIDERSLFPNDLMDWAGVGARAVLKDELRLEVNGPTGGGEVWSGAWRWSDNRPRILFGLSLPAPGMLPGILSIDGSWEEQTYALRSGGNAEGLFLENRRRGAVRLTDWVSGRLKWEAAAALDNIVDRRHVSLEGAIDLRLMDDLVSTGFSFTAWTPTEIGDAFTVTDVSMAWRASPRPRPAWSGIVGVTAATAGAPFAVWPSAGTGGSGRGAYLRAHPLHEHGIITSENFARRLAYFTVEHQRPLGGGQLGEIAIVGFVDGVRAWGGLPGNPRRVNVDIGSGVRFGSGSGTVRLDVGFGLRDQQWAISAGWVNAWPGR